MNDDNFRAPQSAINDTEPRRSWVSKGFIFAIIVILLAVGYFIAEEASTQRQYVLRARLSKIVVTLDPVKIAIAMAYQEKGKVPQVTTVVTQANQGKPATPDWAALGFTTFPSLPREASSLSLAGGGEIVVKLANIAEDINDTEVRATPVKEAQGLSWTYTCTSANNAVKAYFRC